MTAHHRLPGWLVGDYAIRRPSGALFPCTRSHARDVAAGRAGMDTDVPLVLTAIGWRSFRMVIR